MIVIKLSDFGLAKDFSHDSQSTISSMSLSDNWMAPEISTPHQAVHKKINFDEKCFNFDFRTEPLMFIHWDACITIRLRKD